MFPRDFCSTPSLVHFCVDMFISSHKCRYMLINQYFYGSLTNQEMSDQRINKCSPEEKSSLSEVHALCYCVGLFIIFKPPNVIPRSTAEVANENGQVILTE
jgi:hypothetical protein